MKAIDICTKSTKAKQLLIIYLLILPISEQKRNCWNKAQAENRNKTKYVALTNTKARLHQNNATRREKRKRKQKQMRKHAAPTKANTSRDVRLKTQDKAYILADTQKAISALKAYVAALIDCMYLYTYRQQVQLYLHIYSICMYIGIYICIYSIVGKNVFAIMRAQNRVLQMQYKNSTLVELDTCRTTTLQL